MVITPPMAARTGGPGRGTTTTRHRDGVGERADTSNPFPRSPWGTGGFSDPGAANGSGGGCI